MIQKKLLGLLARIFRFLGIVLLSRKKYLELSSKASPTSIELCQRFGLEISSVLHIGSHSGDEAIHYWRHGIRQATFIEANVSIFERLTDHLSQFPGYRGINFCISDKVGRAEFFTSSNDGASSSILRPKRHSAERPDIHFSESSLIDTVTLDSLNLGNFDLIVIDVQGAEGLVVKGGIRTLESARALYLECNIGDMYEGDIDLLNLAKLLEKNFNLVYVDMSENFWGDCFLVRRDDT